MLDITFFTSNNTKLAHARHIVEREPIRIQGFRQKTFYASYNEPRISNRDKLLDQSYESARNQARKSGINLDSHFFFLEDTSVKIDALSDDTQETPGVDIKFWMRATTFDDLNNQLISLGDNRKVTVRSDIVLHIPNKYKKLMGLSQDYVRFSGSQKGHVTRSEINFKTNLMYPWLDNQTFNKWFVPDGAMLPLGALGIDKANRFDFRKKAVEQLVKFLSQHNLLSESVYQGELSLDSAQNIIIAGYSCAGKTEASQFLAEKYKYLHVEASDFMYLSYYLRHGYQSEVPIGDFAELALKERPQIVAEKIAEYLEDFPSTSAIVSGFRSPTEITWLRDKLSTASRDTNVIFVESEQAIRFKRMVARGRSGDDISLDKFRRRDAQQQRMGLDTILSAEANQNVVNDSTLENYYEAIAKAADMKLARRDSFLQSQLISMRKIQGIRLEYAILLSLLTVWSKSEEGKYLTTAEIAKLTSEVFPDSPPKHKDNVSRYFNQNFYPFYEIDAPSSDAKRRYRLSNTGYGKALAVLDTILDE